MEPRIPRLAEQTFPLDMALEKSKLAGSNVSS